MATYKELIAQRDALIAQIDEIQKKERAAVVDQVRDLMSEHGLSMADIGARAGASKQPRAAKKAGAKVAAKYRYKSTGESWSGRGLQPKWLKAAIATGAKIEDFKV